MSPWIYAIAGVDTFVAIALTYVAAHHQIELDLLRRAHLQLELDIERLERTANGRCPDHDLEP